MADTQEPTLPPDRPVRPSVRPRLETGPEAARRLGLVLAGPRQRWWAVPLTVLAGLTLLAVSLAAVVPSEWVASKLNERVGEEQGTPFARTPASAEPVDERIVFGDLGDLAEQYPPEGDFFFVTVTEPEQSALSWFLGRDEPAVEFMTYEEKFGIQTPEQRRTFALEFMRTSEQVAQFVALQRLGYDVSVIEGDVLIEAMVCLESDPDDGECTRWAPSDDVLDPGDRIVSVDDEEVEGVEDLGRILADFAPGDFVKMSVERPGVDDEVLRLHVDVELTADPDDPERAIVGFFPFDTRRVELPFELDIQTGSIGGPSAGLAFTLTLIDELSPGELTGGRRVAVTGTIELDGTVGPIGGLRQKASAVEQAGVEVFLVPAAQGDDDVAAAREVAGSDVEIIQVATLEEALTALAELGGDPLPPPSDA